MHHRSGDSSAGVEHGSFVSSLLACDNAGLGYCGLLAASAVVLVNERDEPVEDIVNWLYHERQWLFSGLGVLIAAGIVKWLIDRRNRSPASAPQTQVSGSHSRNMQAGRDVNLRNGAQ
jgi:hypothetical protein